MKVLTRNPFKKGDKEKVAKGTPSAPLTPSDDIFSEAPPTTPSSKYFWHGSRKEAKAKEQLALELHLAKQHQQQQFNEEIASLGTKLQQYKSAVKVRGCLWRVRVCSCEILFLLQHFASASPGEFTRSVKLA